MVILGDFSYGKAEETNKVLEQLKGILCLVEGNHDQFGHRKGYNAARFKWIRPYTELNDNNRKVILCHYPILCYNDQYLFDGNGNPRTYMLYGHVHNTWDEELMAQQMINCFCMYSDYTPLTLDEWIELDAKRRGAPQ